MPKLERAGGEGAWGKLSDETAGAGLWGEASGGGFQHSERGPREREGCLPWFASAPPSSSAATTSLCPFCAAMMSGVAPSVRAEEKGGAPSKEGHESRKQRERAMRWGAGG